MPRAVCTICSPRLTGRLRGTRMLGATKAPHEVMSVKSAGERAGFRPADNCPERAKSRIVLLGVHPCESDTDAPEFLGRVDGQLLSDNVVGLGLHCCLACSTINVHGDVHTSICVEKERHFEGLIRVGLGEKSSIAILKLLQCGLPPISSTNFTNPSSAVAGKACLQTTRGATSARCGANPPCLPGAGG
jgi:hypothetical protein